MLREIAGNASAGFATCKQAYARIVGDTLCMTWHATYQHITWTWDSFGGARCCGVHIGKELPMTVLAIFACDTICESLSENRQFGEGVPAWTVMRVAWSPSLKLNVSGISTDVVVFSEHGAQLVHHYTGLQ